MVSRRVTFLLVVLAFGLGAAAGVLGLLWATGGSATPSRDAREVAPTLALDAPTAAPATAAPAITEASAAATDEPAAAAPAAQRALYRITEDGSEARFNIDETLLGERITVVGRTSQVAGDLIVDFASPAQSEVGVIAINARALQTDQDLRNQTIRSQILRSGRAEYEFITFEPTALTGLPDSPAQVGDTLDFAIVGNLTVAGVTREVTFGTQVTVEAQDRISGTASATVAYSDFNITIRTPPSVSDVGETVTLELDFTALLVDE